MRDPLTLPFRLKTMRPGSIDERRSFLHRGYNDLAARAKHDPTASRQFRESHLWIETDPTEAKDILREHPLMKPGLVGSGKEEGVGLTILNGFHRASLTWLVSCLAKLSVKEGGEEAAGRLHRYLTAGANASIPAHEITVFHGLVLGKRFDLGADAYLAPYEHAKEEFDLPEEPEHLSECELPQRRRACPRSHVRPRRRDFRR